MKKMKKIDVFALAKLNAIIALFFGLAAGIVYSFGGLIIDTLVSYGFITSTETPGLSYGTVLAFGALIGMPIYFTVLGFFATLIGGFLYNLFVKWFK